MSDKPDRASDADQVQEAKGAAQEAIGKLIGDDAEIRKGRTKRRGGDVDRPSSKSTGQE